MKQVFTMATTEEMNERIEAALWRVCAGEKSLAEMPSSLQAWYFIAHEHGQRSRDFEVLQLTNELAREKLTADRLYLAAYSPAERRDYLLSRLDQAFIDADSDDVDNLISEAVERYLCSLETMRGAA